MRTTTRLGLTLVMVMGLTFGMALPSHAVDTATSACPPSCMTGTGTVVGENGLVIVACTVTAPDAVAVSLRCEAEHPAGYRVDAIPRTLSGGVGAAVGVGQGPETGWRVCWYSQAVYASGPGMTQSECSDEVELP